MQLVRLAQYDRFGLGELHAQLLSSQTSGTFQLDGCSALGSQLVTMPAGQFAVITIESEQILCSALSFTGDIGTATISQRGYNGTTASTHVTGTVGEMHWTKAHADRINEHLARFDDDGLLIPFSTVPTITDATTLSVAGVDVTSHFTPGRAFLYQKSSAWYRGTVVSSSFSTNTTVIINGNGLPASGTITAFGFEMGKSNHSAGDLSLVAEVSAKPATNPPSGYSWLFAKGGNWHSVDSSGNVRFLTPIRASVSSTGGVLTLDCSAAAIFDCTLTENITSVTWQNGVEGQRYFLRLKQHASSAKTVALGTTGGTRFSNTVASYAMTADLSATDELEFVYHGTDAKWDLLMATKGFQASPLQTYIPGATVRRAVVASRDLSTASGSQTIAHNLGVKPNFVRIDSKVMLGSNGNAHSECVGFYDGNNTTSVYSHSNNGSGSGTGSSTSNIINVWDELLAGLQVASITFDATNITLNWTKSGSAGGTCVMMIESSL